MTSYKKNITADKVPEPHIEPLERTPQKPPFTVALVEDQPETRENWAALINSFSDFKCVSTCASGEEAVRVIPSYKPTVVLMDIVLQRMSGIECTSRLKELMPATQIIILTAMDNQGLVFSALKAGADGYLLKRTRPSDLHSALLDVINGGSPMTSHIARRVVETFRENKSRSKDFLTLTPKEEQVLIFLSQGYTNKQLAEKLEVSLDTVGTHMRHVFSKLHVNSRTEAVIRYLSSEVPASKTASGQ